MRLPPDPNPPKRKGLVFWLGLLVVILGLGAVAGWAWARDRYLRELSFRAQQNGPTLQGVLGATNGIPILFLGDSRMAMWPAFPEDRFRTFNAGGYGEVTSQVLHRTPAALALSQPRLVVIQSGINDLKILGLGSGRDAEIPRDCVEHLTNIVAQCVASNAVVIWTTIFPTGPKDWQRKLVWSSEIEKARLAVNQEMKQILGAWGDKVLVLDSDTWIENGSERQFLDSLHLKMETYAKLQSELDMLLTPKHPELGLKDSAAKAAKP